MGIRLEDRYLKEFIKESELETIRPEVEAAFRTLCEKNGPGNDFTGWDELPVEYDREEFGRIIRAAEKIKKDSDVLVVIGIGGSYLGAKSAIDFLGSKSRTEVCFAGNNLSASYINALFERLEGREISLNVISKSGTTTEPAIAFRIFKNYMEKKYGAAAGERIYVTTDKARGTLKELADKNGYQTFVVPDNIGGRYSVLTAVGLLPIAVSGADINAIMEGALEGKKKFDTESFFDNEAMRYAAYRNILYRKGKTAEIMSYYEPSFAGVAEWWKQLYGESEGKDEKGIFPASVGFTTDLHSLGQYIQNGLRNIFETVVWIKNSGRAFAIPEAEGDDGLGFLAGTDISDVNEKAFFGTVLAHVDGGVPNILLELDANDERTYGEMVFFFEKACAVSGYTLGVNPFNQPGVEDYKVNMFALLGKPGYEDRRAELEKRLG